MGNISTFRTDTILKHTSKSARQQYNDVINIDT